MTCVDDVVIQCSPVVGPHHGLDLRVEVAVGQTDHQALFKNNFHDFIRFIAAFCGFNDGSI